MNEEDKKIRELLTGFRPDAEKSEVDFMACLQQKMDTVDTVKEYCHMEKRRNRLAIIVAAIAGILTGVGLTLAIPYMENIFGVVLGTIIPWAIVTLGVLAAIAAAYALTTILSSIKPGIIQLNYRTKNSQITE